MSHAGLRVKGFGISACMYYMVLFLLLCCEIAIHCRFAIIVWVNQDFGDTAVSKALITANNSLTSIFPNFILECPKISDCETCMLFKRIEFINESIGFTSYIPLQLSKGRCNTSTGIFSRYYGQVTGVTHGMRGSLEWASLRLRSMNGRPIHSGGQRDFICDRLGSNRPCYYYLRLWNLSGWWCNPPCWSSKICLNKVDIEGRCPVN